jgi:6-phosphogluconolactonase
MMRVIEAGEDFAQAGATMLSEALRLALADKPRASLALSGGRTPWPALQMLGRADIDWARVDVYQVDERVAPEGDPARNLTGLQDVLLGQVRATVHAMPVEAPDLDAAAARYDAILPGTLDVVHLGLGDDGHTASLVPGDPVLDVTDRGVAITEPYRGHRRMTLTFPALKRAGMICWIVAHARKASMIERLLAGDETIPAGRVPRAHAVLVTDGAGDS